MRRRRKANKEILREGREKTKRNNKKNGGRQTQDRDETKRRQ